MQCWQTIKLSGMSSFLGLKVEEFVRLRQILAVLAGIRPSRTFDRPAVFLTVDARADVRAPRSKDKSHLELNLKILFMES